MRLRIVFHMKLLYIHIIKTAIHDILVDAGRSCKSSGEKIANLPGQPFQTVAQRWL